MSNEGKKNKNKNDKKDTDDLSIKCKVVLIGKSTVGKTSIILRYTSNIFRETSLSTQGANFVTKNVYFPEYKKTIKFEIWDTAGQERYRSLAKMFYNNASACILVYDITYRESFEDIKNFWIPELRENTQDDIILAIAGNKCDNYANETVNDNEGKALAKEINAIYMRTSAKLNSSIDELFNSIGNKFLNPNFEIKGNLTKEELREKSEELRREQIKLNNKNKKRKKCC